MKITALESITLAKVLFFRSASWGNDMSHFSWEQNLALSPQQFKHIPFPIWLWWEMEAGQKCGFVLSSCPEAGQESDSCILCVKGGDLAPLKGLGLLG